MNRIINWIKANYKKFSFSVLFNCILFLIFNVFFYCRFHTNDDVFMEMIASGAYGEPDSHLIYINVIIGFILSNLYRIMHFVPWYGIFQIVLSILSFSVVTYTFLNQDNKTIKIVSLLFIFFSSYEAYTKVQFTKTAAYLATSAYVLLAYSYKLKNKRTYNIVSIIFIWLSFLMRPGMFFAASAISACCILPLLFNSLTNLDNIETRRNIKNLIYVAGISLIVVSFSYFVDKMCYSSKEWSYYKTFNSYTTQFQDINTPSYDTYEEEYNKLGIDYDDYRLYFLYTDHNDPDLLDFEKMQSVKELEPYMKMNLDEFVMFVLRGYSTLFKQKTLAPFTLLTVVLLLYFVINCYNNLHAWVSLLCGGLMTVLAFYYTYIMHGWYDRTTIGVMFSVIAMIMSIIKKNSNRNEKVFLIILVQTFLVMCVYCWNDYYKWNMTEWREECRRNLEIVNELHEDKDHLYLCRTTLPLWKRYYTPYDEIKLGVMGNYSPLGDWISNTPLSINTLSKYNVVNPYKDMVNNEKVYLISKDNDIEIVEIYIKKHYFKNLEMVHVRSIDDYHIYKLIGSN